MHHAFDVDIVEGDENAELRHARHAAGEHFAHFVAHVIGFEPVFHIAAGIVGAPLVKRAAHPQRLPGFRRIFFAVQHRFNGAVNSEVGIAADG